MGTNEAPAGLTGRCPYTGKKLYACFRTNNDSDTDFVPAPWFRHPSKPLCTVRIAFGSKLRAKENVSFGDPHSHVSKSSSFDSSTGIRS